MIQESVACPACHDAVPVGRLSCPHCGAVLAAVAGSRYEPAMAGPAWLTARTDDPEAEAFTDTDVEPAAEPPGVTWDLPDVEPVRHPEPEPEPPAPAPAPGAWLPPTLPPAAADSAPSIPPTPFQARAWEGYGKDEAAAGSTRDDEAGGTADGRWLPVIDGARLDELAGNLVLAGAMATAIGFLVPWSRVVIGARATGGYTDTWGLAGPGHAFVFLAAIAVFALAALPNPVRSWLRTGVLGLLLGSLVFGLVWPYAFGPLGAGPGVILLVVAAFLLVLGGLTSVVLDRHATPPPPV